MKKFFTLALTAVIALSMLTACGSKDNASDDNKGEEGGTTAALSGTVSTDGSTSMEKSSTPSVSPSWPPTRT